MPIHTLLSSLAELAKSASKIKIWEIEVERKVEGVLADTAKAASNSSLNSLGVPTSEVIAAEKVETLMSSLPTSDARNDLTQGIRSKLLNLAQEYDELRMKLPSSPERTRLMNEIMAQMRALGISGRPFLREFCDDRKSYGVRLAAIAILQMLPDTSYLEWLVERMAEEQPFLIFHASLAMLAAVRSYGSKKKDALESAIRRSLDTINSFAGSPDKNALSVLNTARAELLDS